MQICQILYICNLIFMFDSLKKYQIQPPEQMKISLRRMKTKIDSKVDKILSMLSLKQNVYYESRRVQTEPMQEYNFEKVDVQSTIFASKQQENQVKLTIEGFPHTHRDSMPKLASKTYTSRQSLNEKRPTISKVYDTSSTTKVNTAIKPNIQKKSIPQPPKKPQKRISKPKVEQILKKTIMQEMKIMRRTASIVSEKSIAKQNTELEQAIAKMREQNEESYRVRQKMLERVAKMRQTSAKQIK